MEQKTGFKELFLRIVAIVGLIAVLILGAWGIILLAFNLAGIFTGTKSIGSLFSHPNTDIATTTVVVVGTNTNTGSSEPVVITPPVKPVVTTTKPTAVYTAAPQRAALYGLPDLAVTITSVTSLSSVQGRTVVKFIVENDGTNVARAGWNFNVVLPLTPSYTYQATAQQALYPGDKIAYTLTYDDPNFYNQYQNQYYNQNGYNGNYQYQAQQTCYTYNGYQNVAGPCAAGYDSNSNAYYNPNSNYYNQNGGTNYYNGTNYPTYRSGTVTVVVDPQNWILEAIEYNNTASRSTY